MTETTWNCVSCGYDLTGLDPRGRCPECGQDYDVSSGTGLTSHFSARYARTSFILARIRTVVLGVLTLLVLAAGLLATMWMQSGSRPLVVSMVFAGVLGMAAIASFMYERE